MYSKGDNADVSLHNIRPIFQQEQLTLMATQIVREEHGATTLSDKRRLLDQIKWALPQDLFAAQISKMQLPDPVLH